LLSASAQEGLISEARSEWGRNGILKKRTDATEACAWKIAQSEGRRLYVDPDSRTYREEAESGCHNCYVGGSNPHKKMPSLIF